MSDLGFEFDASTVEIENDFQPIPAGVYVATVKGAEVKPTKDGTGKILNVQWHIDGPEHSGRVVFDGINIVNKSDTAQKIARQQLASLCNAVGLGKLTDSQALIGRTAKLKIAIEIDKSGQYDPSNRVKRYSSAGGMQSQSQPNAPAAQIAPSTAPWG